MFLHFFIVITVLIYICILFTYTYQYENNSTSRMLTRLSCMKKPVSPVTMALPSQCAYGYSMNSFFDLFTDYNDNAGAVLKKPEGLMYDEQQQAWKNDDENQTPKQQDNEKNTQSKVYGKLLSNTDDTMTRFYTPVKRDVSELNTYGCKEGNKITCFPSTEENIYIF